MADGIGEAPLPTEDAAASFLVSVLVRKPSAPSWKGRSARRQFIGVSWDLVPPPPVGVRLKHTFLDLPSAGCLFAGDVIERVADEPVGTAEDVVFHWERVKPGRVAFSVRRTETHRFVLNHAALRGLELTWHEQPPYAPAPVVETTNATPELLRALQQPAAPHPGDLVLAINGVPVATRQEAAALLGRAAQSEDTTALTEVSVWRGVPVAIEGDQASECCCACEGVTRVPKPKKRKPKGALENMSPALLLHEPAPPSDAAHEEMES
jgi:hypothetical protein